MSIGAKQKHVTIQKATAVPDGHGGHTTTWSTRCTVWAHERPLSGTEALRAQQVTAVLSSVFEVWFRLDLSVKDRVIVGTRTCEIESILDPKDDRKELYLFTSEVAQ
jgi:SPP1 family predicted phage head-tail adaptor